MAPFPGIATSTAAVLTALASCGLWVCQEDLTQSLLGPPGDATPAGTLFSAPGSAALPVDTDVSHTAVDAEGPSQWWQAVWMRTSSLPWIFLLVDVCVAVLIGGACVLLRRYVAMPAASKSTAAVTLSGNSCNAASESAVASCADSIELAVGGDAVATDGAIPAVLVASGAGVTDCPPDGRIVSPRSKLSPHQPSPVSTPSKQASPSAGSRAGSRGASSRITAPRGVDEWLARRRSPQSASKSGSPDVDDGKSVELTPVSKKSGSSVASAKAAQQPKGVQEWLSKHQSPAAKQAQLEETLACTSPSAGVGANLLLACVKSRWSHKMREKTLLGAPTPSKSPSRFRISI